MLTKTIRDIFPDAIEADGAPLVALVPYRDDVPQGDQDRLVARMTDTMHRVYARSLVGDEAGDEPVDHDAVLAQARASVEVASLDLNGQFSDGFGAGGIRALVLVPVKASRKR